MKKKAAGNVIADNLKRCRKEAGYTQEEAARHLGICRSAYTNYETGRREPKVDYLLELAKFYGVRLVRLIEGE